MAHIAQDPWSRLLGQGLIGAKWCIREEGCQCLIDVSDQLLSTASHGQRHFNTSANWMWTKVYDEPESLPMMGLGAFSFPLYAWKIAKTSVANVTKRICCLTCCLSREACRVALDLTRRCPCCNLPTRSDHWRLYQQPPTAFPISLSCSSIIICNHLWVPLSLCRTTASGFPWLLSFQPPWRGEAYLDKNVEENWANWTVTDVTTFWASSDPVQDRSFCIRFQGIFDYLLIVWFWLSYSMPTFFFVTLLRGNCLWEKGPKHQWHKRTICCWHVCSWFLWKSPVQLYNDTQRQILKIIKNENLWTCQNKPNLTKWLANKVPLQSFILAFSTAIDHLFVMLFLRHPTNPCCWVIISVRANLKEGIRIFWEQATGLIASGTSFLAAKHANDTSATLGTFHARLYAGQHSSHPDLQLRPVKWSPTQALKKLIGCFLHSYLPMTTPQTSFFFQYGLVLLSWLTSDVWTVWKHALTQKSSEALHPVVCQPCQYWTSGHCEEKELSHMWQEICHLTTTRGFLHTDDGHCHSKSLSSFERKETQTMALQKFENLCAIKQL